MSWRVHIACNHIEPFLKANEHGLGVYAGQTGEAIHHHFKKNYWDTYKRRMERCDYAKRLKKSVVDLETFQTVNQTISRINALLFKIVIFLLVLNFTHFYLAMCRLYLSAVGTDLQFLIFSITCK